MCPIERVNEALITIKCSLTRGIHLALSLQPSTIQPREDKQTDKYNNVNIIKDRK